MARKPPKRKSVFDALADAVNVQVEDTAKALRQAARKPPARVLGPALPAGQRGRAWVAPPPPPKPIKTKPAPVVGLDKLGPPSRDKQGRPRRIGGGALFSNREILALDHMLTLPKKQQVKVLGKRGQKELANYGRLKDEERRARVEAATRHPSGIGGALLGLFPGSRLWNVQPPGVTTAAALTNVPRAAQVLGTEAFKDLGRYFERLPERERKRGAVERAGLPLPIADIGEGIGKALLGGAAAVHGAFAHPGAAKRDVSNQANAIVQLPGILYGAIDPWKGDVERVRMIKQAYEENRRALLEQYGPDVSWRESYRKSMEMPVTAGLTAVGVAAPIARVPSLATGLARGLSFSEALAAGSRPYLLGKERTLRLRGGPGGRGIDVPIEYARSPLFRPIQRGYDAISRRLPETTPVVRHFAEPQRAARATRRSRQRDIRRDMAEATAIYEDIDRLDKKLGLGLTSEEARLVFTRDKPEGVPDEVWLGAMVTDLDEMINGRAVLLPDRPDPPSLVKARRRLNYLQRRFDQAVERRAETIMGEKLGPLVTQSRSLREQIRYRRRQGEDTSVLEQQLYDVNARLELGRGERVRPVKDSPQREQFARTLAQQVGQDKVGPLMQVADALARAVEPENPAKWYATRLADSSVGTAEEMARLVAQGEGLWQRPGYAYNLVRHDNPPAVGDLVWTTADEGPFVVSRVALNDAGELSHYEIKGVTGAGTLYPNEIERVVNLPEGRNVVTRGGERGTIVNVDPEGLTATLKSADNEYQVDVAISDIAPEHAPVFYSHAQRVFEEKGQKKSSPEQVAALFRKEGVKEEELEWSGISDWIEVLQESGVKSLSKDEVLRFLANPLDAFNLAEVHLTGTRSYSSAGYDHDFHPRWESYGESGLVVREPGYGDYHELVMTLPKETVFRHGHWQGISNPLVHIRFHHVENPDGTKSLLIDEVQSDWHQAIQKQGVRPKEAEALIDQLRVDATKLMVKQQELAMKFGLDVTAETAHDGIYRLWNQMMRDVQRYVEDTPGTDIATATRESGLDKLIQAYRLSDRWETRKRALQDEERSLHRGQPAAPFQKNRWIELAVKRMVAYAAREGFDRLEWVDGHVQAVRYELFHGGIEEAGGDYAHDPTEHPQYPDQDDHMNHFTYAEHQLNAGPAPGEYLQERLFAEVGGEPFRPPGPVPMAETQPLRLLADEVDPELGLVSGDLWTPSEGPFEGVLMRLIGRDGDDWLAVPSGITNIEVRSNKYGGDWADQYAEVIFYDESGKMVHSYETTGSSGSYLEDLLDDDDLGRQIIHQPWFNEIDRRFDNAWESELDEYEYNNAVETFNEEYAGEIGGIEHDFDSIHGLSHSDLTDSGRGVVRFYDEVMPNTVGKLFKSDDIKVEKGTIEGRYSTESKGAITEHGPINTWGFDLSPSLKQKALDGQRLFQATHHGNIKGAVEFLGGDRTALRLFASADVSTVLHELGHIGLFDMDPEDIAVIDRDLAGERSYLRGEWLEEDHERYARAWERYFLDGKAERTALRGVFDKLMQWMRLIYTQATGLGVRVSPEVEAVFTRRLGRAEMTEPDIVRYAGKFDKEVSHWGAVLAQAKTDMQSLEARLNAMAEHGTDSVLLRELDDLQTKRKEALSEEAYQEYTDRIEGIEAELQEMELNRVSRARRREKLLQYQMSNLEQALKAPKDQARYEMAVLAADWLQNDRENILRAIFGEAYDEVFEGRRRQMSQWLASRGALSEADVGAGRGFLPFSQQPPVGRSIRTTTSPRAQKIGKQSTRELNLHKRNEMILWQLGDFQADPKILMESWGRAASFKWAHDLRSLLWDIGDDVPRDGPPEDYYLININGKPLPRHWEKGLSEADIAKIMDDLEGGSDDGLANRLHLFIKNWISDDPTEFRGEDGTYPGVRMVHKSVVHSLVLPYQSASAVKGLLTTGEIVNSLARLSLIYMNPGYIPSNWFANFIMGMANSPWFPKDLAEAGRIMATDKKLSRMITAEMGEASLGAMLPQNLRHVGRIERRVAEAEQTVADIPFRIGGWISTARRNGYRGRDDLVRLLTSKDPQVIRDKNFISREATNAMIDFDRLSPMEKRYVQPWLFVWPFLRGAMAWPVSYTMTFPERAALAAVTTAGYGEEEREQLGPVPPYYEALVPLEVDRKEGVGTVANLQSVSPLGPFADLVKVAYGLGRSGVKDDKVDAFNTLFGYVAPQYQSIILMMQGRSEFGGQEGLRTMATRNLGDIIPGWGFLADIRDETKPAIYMEQDFWNTLYRRTFRFSPQQVNINVLNERAAVRGAKTPEQKTNILIKRARSWWSKANPTEPMPRSVEQSIRAFYAYSEARDLKQEAIKKSGDWHPKRGEHTPKLTPLQDTTLAYDILRAYFPAVIDSEGLPDPQTVAQQQGEAAVEAYGRAIKRVMFRLKEKAQEGIRLRKEMAEAGVAS